MTRGNQREQDRLKAQKKAASQAKGPKESGASLAKRKEADADAVRAKAAAKAAARAAAEASGGGTGKK
ncbi:four F5 protein [Violaceomyces palustris]|uniref:Four F5 protein n=1 Tax=Violaceomyces palustris TaxID=1673888 RepID=A0ACD0NTB4_9BASI|nr:four F5 protein [Violaceomyces palustris]